MKEDIAQNLENTVLSYVSSLQGVGEVWQPLFASFAARGKQVGFITDEDTLCCDALFLDLRVLKDSGSLSRIFDVWYEQSHLSTCLYLLLRYDEAFLSSDLWRSMQQRMLVYAVWEKDRDASLRYCGVSLPEAVDPLLPHDFIILAFHPHYDPVAHANELTQKGQAAFALEVLENIPPALVSSQEERAAVKVFPLLIIDRQCSKEGQLARFAKIYGESSKAATWAPHWPSPYQHQAMAWRRIGYSDMGCRLLRTFLHVHEDKKTRALLEVLQEESGKINETFIALPSSFTPLKVLFLLHAQSDYGSDVLYDGLCRVLGSENVIEYPGKPYLHGESSQVGGSYPCMFDWPRSPHTREDIQAMLEAGEFDVILYSDTLLTLDKEEIRSLLSHAKRTPLFIVDMWDQCGDYWADIAEYIDYKPISGYFKREYLRGGNYHENTIPLPFSYSEGRIPTVVNNAAREGLFWAGKIEYGTRTLTLSFVRDKFGVDITQQYSQEEYVAVLRNKLMGLCLFGNGFDTVRYWELPAHGCMLLAERLPIVVPYDFEDGVSAVFFDDLKELEEKLTYYLQHREEAQQIAMAGHTHLCEHHTSTCRARYMLAQIAARLAQSKSPGYSKK